MRVWNTLGMAVCLIVGGIFVSGCATNITRPASAPQPSPEPFGTFETVIYENVTIAPKFASANPNQRAAGRINEELITGLNNVFPGMQVVDHTTQEVPDKTLVIRPKIKEIKFIGGAARFWVGAMAGSSAVLMQVDFLDQSTGTVLTSPQFYRSAGAMSGGGSMGASDNMMLSAIAQDIVTYTVSNR